jgi:hypothetical protein
MMPGLVLARPSVEQTLLLPGLSVVRLRLGLSCVDPVFGIMGDACGPMIDLVAFHWLR